MLEFAFTLLFCAGSIVGIILSTKADALTIVCYGGLISFSMLVGSIWAASYSKRSNNFGITKRGVVLGAGWLAGPASLSLLAFIFMLIFSPAIFPVAPNKINIFKLILAYGLISLLGVPAIVMERRLKKSEKLETNL
jgi:hypothetical protein